MSSRSRSRTSAVRHALTPRKPVRLRSGAVKVRVDCSCGCWGESIHRTAAIATSQAMSWGQEHAVGEAAVGAAGWLMAG